MSGATTLHVEPVTTAVGATVSGIELRKPLDSAQITAIRQELLTHGVLVFRDQEMTLDELRAFVTNFGTPIPEPFSAGRTTEPVTENDLLGARKATSVWHVDTSYIAEPPSLTALRAVSLPPVGGDTCWASMTAAFEALSSPMQRLLGGLTAVHSVAPVVRRMGVTGASYAEHSSGAHGTEFVHPVVSVHPETGKRVLFVNEGWTTQIVELTSAESRRVLDLLFEHVKSPDFTMRLRWAPNTLALWDNRTVQHYAVPDYQTSRVMQRVILAGDLPVGLA